MIAFICGLFLVLSFALGYSVSEYLQCKREDDFIKSLNASDLDEELKYKFFNFFLEKYK